MMRGAVDLVKHGASVLMMRGAFDLSCRLASAAGIARRLARVLGALAIAASAAGAAPWLHFEPDTLSAAPGAEPFEWAIWIDGGGDSIACYSVTMTLDTTHVVLVEATEGGLFANSGSTTFFVSDSLSATESRFIDCVLGYRTFVLGPGEIVRLLLQPRSSAPVWTEVLLGEAIVTDIDRQEIPGVEVASGWLRLNALSEAEEPGGGGGGAPGSGEPEGGGPGGGACGSLRAWPNPATGAVHLEWRASAARRAGVRPVDQVSARLLDPAGRLVCEIPLRVDGSLATGVWTGRASETRRALPGLYFISLEPPGLAAPARLLLLDSDGGR